MNTIDAFSVAAERNENKANLENGFYNIVNGERISTGKKRSVIHAAINHQLAAVPDLEHALLAMAMSAARDAFSGWAAVPFESRKAILASLFNKLHDRADELSTVVTAEQRVTPAEARWEINLLTEGFGPALMQMELSENEQDVQPVRQITKRYVRVDELPHTQRGGQSRDVSGITGTERLARKRPSRKNNTVFAALNTAKDRSNAKRFPALGIGDKMKTCVPEYSGKSNLTSTSNRIKL